MMELSLNMLKFYFDLLDDGSHEQLLSMLLDPLEARIRSIEKNLDEVDKSDNEDFKYFFVDDASAEVDELVGVSFVVCQIFINKTVSMVIKFDDLLAKLRTGQRLQSVPTKRKALLQTSSRLISDSKYSAVTAVNAFANYYKHRDEWPGRWDKLNGTAKKTKDVISALGAAEGSSCNLLQGALALGGDDHPDLQRFATDVCDWHRALKTAIRAELEPL